MAGVQPFRFEPQTDSSGDSEPDPGDDNVWDGGDVETERWRLGNRDWCRCGNEDNRNCLEMPSVRESVCCHDPPELTDTDKNVGTDHPCIRNHPDFDVILHPANLRTLLIFRWDLIRQGVQEPVSNILCLESREHVRKRSNKKASPVIAAWFLMSDLAEARKVKQQEGVCYDCRLIPDELFLSAQHSGRDSRARRGEASHAGSVMGRFYEFAKVSFWAVWCSGTSLDYEAGRPGFDSGSYPNKSEHAPRRCTLGKGENEYLALARDVPRIGRKMEVPCLGESHPTHVKEPTALIEKMTKNIRDMALGISHWDFQYVQQLLEDDYSQVTEKQIANLARDKGQWRDLAVACNAADR
ncbi:hypothetical protein Bbelb_248390 [Branchiostoma belcheri]|nr:hypothetical protein Bbelb_248390 [Branchiostoma belcheri]